MKKKEIIRNRLQNRDVAELQDVLKTKNKCILIRPTGYGKTFILSKLTGNYNRVLYVYPLEIIRLALKNSYSHAVNADYISYSKLVTLYKSDKIKLANLMNRYDLVILDEAHMAGADITSNAVKIMMEHVDKNGLNTKFIGATATPDRGDGYDVVGELFDNQVISDYGLNNAIEDGIINKPYYIYSVYESAGYLDSVKGRININTNSNESDDIIDKLTALEVEMGNILNASKVIKESIDTVYKEDIDYMKFIVFYSGKQTLQLKHEDVEKWFKEAYPSFKIDSLIITSDSEYTKNTDKLDGLRYKNKEIQLIHCIDMLNMGYHITDLTGVIMLRGTQSNIVYKQQVGRCLSVDSDNTPIIIDLVNNILKKPYFGGFSGETGINKDLNFGGGRLSDLSIMNLIVNDRLAKYNRIIDKLVNEFGRLRIEDAIRLYVDKSMPMKVLVRHTRLREQYIRGEFSKRGIVVDD